MSLLTYRDHDNRPWGSFNRFTKNEPCTVKLITVSPDKRLSLQKHSHRSEFWHIISGSGSATVGEHEYPAHPGDEFEIPTGTTHRISAGQAGLTFLEIAFGEFDENDIVRLEDDFGRSDGV